MATENDEICRHSRQSSIEFAKTVGKTRGSALIYDAEGELREGLDECFRLKLSDGADKELIQELSYKKEGSETSWRKVRPIPDGLDFFENVWRGYRENKNIY